MMSARLALGIAVTVVAVACARGIKPEVVQGWVGQPAVALEREWGPATREVQEGPLRILIYEEVARRSTTRSFEQQTALQNRAGTFSDPRAVQRIEAEEAARAPMVYVRSYLFWVDQGGTVVRSEIQQP